MSEQQNLIPIIGLEVHCQLNTNSKLFCSCSSDFRNDEPNTHVCPICLGLPGTLPTLNKKAVEFGIKIGMALNCNILETGVFSRKNYFYPDLVKAYQITMGDFPLGIDGYLAIETEDNCKKFIHISRIHLEEDPGRLIHVSDNKGSHTLVDYNRSGIPLIEIVTAPEIESPKEARLFLNKLRSILEYIGVFDPDKEGSLRVDANISFKGHNRVEIKNISSYRGVEKALLYEMKRQKMMIEKNEYITRETRHFHESNNTTTSGRSKETAMDYRYFQEPDLPLIHVSNWQKNITLPELPDQRCERLILEYNIPKNYATVLTSNFQLANLYEKLAPISKSISAIWLVDVLVGELNYRNLLVKDILKYENWISEWIKLLHEKIITDKSAITIIRLILDEIISNNIVEMPSTIMERLNLKKESVNTYKSNIEKIIENNKKALDDHLSGKKGALNFIIGQVMKETKGKLDPSEITNIINEIISKR